MTTGDPSVESGDDGGVAAVSRTRREDVYEGSLKVDDPSRPQLGVGHNLLGVGVRTSVSTTQSRGSVVTDFEFIDGTQTYARGQVHDLHCLYNRFRYD